MRKILDVQANPVGKPRWPGRDRWKKRDAVLHYRAFCDLLRLHARAPLPESNIHIVFYIAMPRSWSAKKRAQMRGQPHRQKPDRDNLEKAVLDALMPEDCMQWDARTTKYWADEGRVVIWELGEPAA